MNEHVFENGFKAELIHNEKSKEAPYVVRLYTANDTFLSSVPCDPDNFKIAAKGLMYGYASGWGAHATMIARNIEEALLVDFPN